MFTNLGRTVAALACTLVMSATCVIGAVGPAQAGTAAPVSVAHVA